MTIFDEAHLTTGKEDKIYSLALEDKYLSSEKRLFMTATPKILSDSYKAKLEKENRANTVYDMGDEDTYGPVFAETSFAEAIEQGIISDYTVLGVYVDRNAEVNDHQALATALNKLQNKYRW